jgi:hypothetical protein
MVMVNNPPISTKRTVTSHLKKDQEVKLKSHDIFNMKNFTGGCGDGNHLMTVEFFLYRKKLRKIIRMPVPIQDLDSQGQMSWSFLR